MPIANCQLNNGPPGVQAQLPAKGCSLGEFFRSEIWALGISTAATLAIILGTYFASQSHSAPAAENLLATLAIGAIWTALACPVLAAGGKSWLRALLRAGVVVDMLGIAFLIIWIAQRSDADNLPCLTVVGAMKAYCIYLAMCLVAVAAVGCARSPAGRYVAAVVAAVLLMAAMASPFWVNGTLEKALPANRAAIIGGAVGWNPFYSLSAAVVEETKIVWHQLPVLYSMTRIGEYTSPGPIQWAAILYRYGLVAGVLTTVAIVRARFAAGRTSGRQSSHGASPRTSEAPGHDG